MKRLNLIFFMLGFAFLSATIVKLGANEILSGILSVGWSFIPITAVNFLWYASNAFGWRVVYRDFKQAEKLPAPGEMKFILAMIAGEAINNATPFFNLGGEPVKGLLIGLGKGDGERIVTSLIVDNTINYISTALFISAGLFFSLFVLELKSGVKYGLIASCVVVLSLIAAFLLLQIKGIFADTTMRLMKFFKKENPEIIARIKRIDGAIIDFYYNKKRSFLLSIWWHLLARIIATFDAMFILYFMGIKIDLLTAFFIQSISVLINLVFMFIPLQVGAAEGGHYALFSSINRDPIDGVEFSLIRRLRGVIWIAIGLVIMATGRKNSGD